MREAEALRYANLELTAELSAVQARVAGLEAQHERDVARQEHLQDQLQQLQGLTQQLSGDLASQSGRGHGGDESSILRPEALEADERQRATAAPHQTDSSSSTSQLSQLDRDIQALKRSLHSLLA